MLIYCFNDAKRFAYTDVIADDVPVPDYATTVPPVNADGSGMYAPTWDGTRWMPMAKEEFEKEFAQLQHPEVKPEPTQEEQAAAQQMLTVADLQGKVDALTSTVDELSKSNNELNATLAQIMLQNAINAETNGGK